MAKGKYEYWLTPDGLLRLEAYARDGLSDEQISHNANINTKTLWDWKKRYDPICNALKRGKEVVDIEVENALLKKTQGYNVELKKTFKIKRTEYDGNGRKTIEQEELVTGVDEIHVPADTTAQIFWLKNRNPERWRDVNKGEYKLALEGEVSIKEKKGLDLSLLTDEELISLESSIKKINSPTD